MPPVDKTDLKILDLLQNDASRSTNEIADHVGLSASPCWRRISLLEQQGVIRRRVALLDREKLGLGVTVVVQVRLTTHGRQSLVAFEERVRELPEVTQCFTVMGAIDFVLIVVTRDIRAYERFMREELAQLPGVQAIESNIVMSAIKDTTALPLELVEPPAESQDARRARPSDARS
jgi:Lrp/AsnC family transcriptional regulator, cysteine-sensing transcriptional activator